MWDAVHTVIRPVGGALIAVATLGDASPTVEGLVGAARRRARRQHALHQSGHARGGQHQPEPFSNWVLSIGEDIFVVGLGFLALKYPAAAAVIVIVAVHL